MPDSTTFWLTLTNIVLGVLVLLLLWGIFAGTLCEYVSRLHKRHGAIRDLDREMKEYFHRK